jgi:hypothetical protein
MIDCGNVKMMILPESETHVRGRVEQGMPPGHLPKRLVDLIVKKGDLASEIGALGIKS